MARQRASQLVGLCYRIGVEMALETFGDVRKEAKHVIRGLLRSPGFTLVAVLTMALSIGANTAIFSVIETVLLRPLPYHDPSSIVMLWSRVPSKDIQRNWTSYPAILDWRSESHSFTQIAVLLLTLKQGVSLTPASVLLGTVLGLLAVRFMKSLLYGITSNNPVTYLGVVGVVSLVALVASFLPARRAASVDPVRSLRTE